MNYPKYYIGPMSKNVVDAILEFIDESGNQIGLIPSRRQIEFDGGYVNNWTTEQFSSYINGRAIIKRDHAGPGQGYLEDDGYKSLREDCKYLNMIHIDPWKKYSKYEEGLRWTIKMIEFCEAHSSDNLYYEVGTEQAIRRFGTEQLDKFMLDLKGHLNKNVFERIKYLVIQSGTSLKGNENTGRYNSLLLKMMVAIAKKYNKLTKEHNGDYLPSTLIKEKFSLGLDAINIAPEFGQIETKTYLEKINSSKPELLDIMYKICYKSKRWEKWVDDSFIPEQNKEVLINICGHYILADSEFLRDIKSNFPDVDKEIKENIKIKLMELTNG